MHSASLTSRRNRIVPAPRRSAGGPAWLLGQGEGRGARRQRDYTGGSAASSEQRPTSSAWLPVIKAAAGSVILMTQVLWQRMPGENARPATVHSSPGLDLPQKIEITASVSDEKPLRRGVSYMQLSVPGVGPVLAWVGVPGGGQRDGHFIHPISGRVWPWHQMRDAVEYAIEYANQRP